MRPSHTVVVILALLIPGKLLSAAAPGQVVVWGTKNQGVDWFVERVEINSKSITNAIAISAGRDHALILRADGNLVGWGRNLLGQTNIPDDLNNVAAVAVGAFFSVALDKDGKLSAWGCKGIKSEHVEGGVAISAGYAVLTLRRDGKVFQSSDTSGLVSGLTNIVAVAAGGGNDERNLALCSDGALLAWGTGDVPRGLSHVTAIATGEYHSLALKADGTVYGWGDNHCEQATGIPNPKGQRNASGLVVHSGQVLSNVVAIAAGNQYGQFGIVSHYSLALKMDGTVVGWGRICGRPVVVPEGLSNVVAIAAGQTFCLAITTNSVVAERFRQ